MPDAEALTKEICLHCGMPVLSTLRNPSGECDHLRYPTCCQLGQRFTTFADKQVAQAKWERWTEAAAILVDKAMKWQTHVQTYQVLMELVIEFRRRAEENRDAD